MKLLTSVIMIIILFTSSTLATYTKTVAKTNATTSKNLKTKKYVCFCIGCVAASIGVCCKTDCSDIRLKEEINFISKLPNGLNLYRWKWNKTAQEVFGKSGYSEGVIAQEVLEIIPNAVSELNGFYQVNYNMVFGN